MNEKDDQNKNLNIIVDNNNQEEIINEDSNQNNYKNTDNTMANPEKENECKQIYDEKNNQKINDYATEANNQQNTNSINQNNTNMNQDNQNNNQNAQVNSSDQIKMNFIQFLKSVRDWSNNNDAESTHNLSEKIPLTIQNFLAANFLTYPIEYMKLILIFLANYIQIRVNYLECMSNNEVSIIFRILDPVYPYYMNINNNNGISLIDYELMMRELFTPFGFETGSILNQNFKLDHKINIFFRYMLTFILQTNFFQNFITTLKSSYVTLEYDRFYFIYSNLLRVMNYYEFFDHELVCEFMRVISAYYEKLFEYQQIKEMNKNSLENFLKNNSFNDFTLLNLFGDMNLLHSHPVENKLFSEFMMKDLNVIYYLLLSQNLEKRVLGMNGLTELIKLIINYEKIDENICNSNYKTLKIMVIYKKKTLIEWLEKIEIFRIIFGENIHEAILKKSSHVLIFLYINDKLSFDQIDFIWKIAQDKHEAISDSILNLFSDLISHFTIDHAMHILKIINEISLKEINDVTVKILDSFSNNKYISDSTKRSDKDRAGTGDDNKMISNIDIMNLKSDGNLNLEFQLDQPIKNAKDINDFKSFYLKILWKLSSENSFHSGLAAQIISKSRKVFAGILVKPVFRNELAKYIKKCILGIGYKPLVSTNLIIFDMIVKNMKQANSEVLGELLKVFGNEIKDMKSFLDYLERQFSLTSVILHAIINLKKEVMVISSEIINTQTNFNSTKPINNEGLYEGDTGESNKFQIKFKNQPEREESLEKEISSINATYVKHTVQQNLMENYENINHNISENNRCILINELELNNNNNLPNNNLDETLSTEKSLDNSISTISTDSSSIEKSRIHMINEFIENYYNSPNSITGISLNNIQRNSILIHDNYDIIFKNLKLNFSNANYFSIIFSLLEFMKYIIFASNIQITQNQIEYLFTLLVENAVDEEEMNLFYKFFAELFRYQFITKQVYISEDNFNFLLFDILLKIEISTLPYSAFNLFKQIFFYINSTSGNLSVISQKIVDVMEFSHLVGFETLWKIYIEAGNLQIFNDSQSMLVNLIGVMAKKEDNRDSFIFIFEKIFNNLQEYFTYLQTKQHGLLNENDLYIERTNRLISLLFTVNSTKQKFERPKSEILNLNIQNYFYGGDGKKTSMSVSSETTIKELKNIIITKISTGISQSDASDLENLNKLKVNENAIMLMSKGKFLKNENLTLKDLKIETGSSIQVHKCEYNFQETEISDERLWELVSDIKNIFENLEDEVLKRALKKNSYNCDETVVYLFDESNIATIRVEIQEDNFIPIQDIQSKFNFELFNEEKICLLIAFLDLEIESLSKNIWQLMSAIKMPSTLISMLTEPGLINFHRIMDIDKPNHILVYLRIINCLVFNDKYFMNLCKLDETKQTEWKINLLITDGLTKLIESIIKICKNLEQSDCVFMPMTMSNIQVLQILSKWLHFFTFSTALSLSPNKESLLSLIKQIICKRPHGIQIGIALNNTSTTPNSLSSGATPTFGSPHSSFSAGDKKNQNVKSSSIIGAEDYDSNYEEEVSNTYYFRLISLCFHVSVINYLNFASKNEIILNYNSDLEPITLNFIEVLIILNDINREAFKETLINEFENSVIINFLFVEKSKFVRKVVENVFNILLSQYKSYDINLLSTSLKLKPGIKTMKDFLMTHILNNYKRIYTGQVYEEFFNLFGTMLVQKNDSPDDIFGEDFNVDNLTSHILEIIYNLSLKKDFELSEIEQEQLSGNLHLFQCLCANNDQIILKCLDKYSYFNNNISIINFLYKCLFSIDNEYNNYVQFNYSIKHIRQKAYSLLLSLIRLKDTYKKELASCLVTHHKSFKNDVFNNMDLDIGIRSKSDKFIGLRNYGCTCYLNSLIQQLYMIPSFRYGIYSVDILENQENFPDLEKNPLYQLQLLFANLSYSLKQYHTPLHFIRSFSDAFNNEPINVAVQQDCEEFLNILIDKLEVIAKKLNKEHIFNNSIRGKLSYETISIEKEYPYYSENENSCLAISLDIKNKRNIEEALDLYVKGEILEGENKYYCEKYDKKISIIRRCSIKSLPPNVFIHLKRFEFDYNTFDRIKLNDYCEFPNMIDFKPWTRTSIYMQNKEDPSFKEINIEEEELIKFNDPEAFKYKLTGILVHQGSTAESGHYFSFISDPETDKWYKFDDSKISDFNLADVRADCFGEDKENFDLFSKTQNAYLLIYTKCAQVNPKVLDKISFNLIDQIKKENMLFLKYKNYLDNDYFMFLKDFIDYSILKNKSVEKLSNKENSMKKIDLANEEIYNETVEMVRKSNLDFKNKSDIEQINKIYHTISCNVESSLKNKNMNNQTNLKKNVIKLSIYYYFGIIVQQRDKHKTNSYANFIIQLLESDRSTAAWFLKTLISNRQLFVEHVLNHNSIEVREGVCRIINNSIHSLYHEEQKYINETFKYFVQVPDNESGFNLEVREEYRSCCMRFFKNNILNLFDSTRPYWIKFQQFQQIIFECFNSHIHETVAEANRDGLFTKIICFITNNQGVFQGSNIQTMGSKAIEPNFSILVEILSLIILSSITNGIYNLKQYSPYSIYQSPEYLLKLSDENLNLLLDRDVLEYFILKKFHSDLTVKMVHHLAWGDLKTSNKIISSIINALRENLKDIFSMSNLIKNSYGLIEVDDCLKFERIKRFFCLDDQSEIENDSIFNYLMSYRDECPLCVMICLKLLGDMMMKNSTIVNYVLKYNQKLVWIYYLLKDITNDHVKSENLRIEANTENYNFMELFNVIEETYLVNLKIRNLINSHNSNVTFTNINENYDDMQIDFKELNENPNSYGFDKDNNQNEPPPGL